MGIKHLDNTEQNIGNRIFTIRGLQVMLDTDLAELYGVETKRLTEQVRRNVSRFPDSFRFQLSEGEWEVIKLTVENPGRGFLRSQNATLKTGRGQHRKYLPFAFTEQGVAMLSAVLRSETAVLVSIRIMQAFVVMRKAFVTHAPLIQRVERLEEFKNEANARIDLLFSAIEEKSPIPEKGIFFEGEVFDAWVFISDLVRSAKLSILLIDNFMDDTVLTLFMKRNEGVAVTIFTRKITPQLALEADKFNKQYGGLTLRQLTT
jgi:phage regulator Rha-like protein